jgi:hypothetical protein
MHEADITVKRAALSGGGHAGATVMPIGAGGGREGGAATWKMLGGGEAVVTGR